MAETKPKTPEPIASVKSAGTLLALAVDRAQGCAYVGGSDGQVYELPLNGAEWQLRSRFASTRYVAALGLIERGPLDRRLLVGRYDGSLTWHQLHTGRSVRHIERAHDGWIRDLQWLDDGQRFVTVGDDMLLKLWSVTSGQLLHTFAGHERETPQGYVSALYSVAAANNSSIVATADRVGDVRVWDVDARRLVTRFQSGEFYTFDPEKRDRSIGGIRRVRFSPDGKWLALSGIGQISNVDGFVGPARVEVWDWRQAKRVFLGSDTHQAVLNDLAWNAAGTHLVASGGGDGGGVLLCWKVGDEKPLQKIKLKGHTQRLEWARHDEQLLLAGFEGVQLWETGSWWHNATSEPTS